MFWNSVKHVKPLSFQTLGAPKTFPNLFILILLRQGGLQVPQPKATSHCKFLFLPFIPAFPVHLCKLYINVYIYILVYHGIFHYPNVSLFSDCAGCDPLSFEEPPKFCSPWCYKRGCSEAMAWNVLAMGWVEYGNNPCDCQAWEAIPHISKGIKKGIFD